MNLSDVGAAIDPHEAGALAAQWSTKMLVVVITGALAIRISRLAIRRVDDDRTREQLLFFVPKVIGTLATVGAIAAIGVDVSGMAAVMATIGVTGAVVFTPVGQNFVAGAMIRIDDVYDIGDAITVNDLHGTVVYRSLLRTELELPDGSKAWVPNSRFQDGEVLNHSRLGGWRICVQIPLDRSTDRRRAHSIMRDVVAGLDWNQPGKPAFVAFDHVGSEATFFNAFAWIEDRTAEPWYRGLLLDELVDALEDAGVSVGQTTNLSIDADRSASEPSPPTESGGVADHDRSVGRLEPAQVAQLAQGFDDRLA